MSQGTYGKWHGIHVDEEGDIDIYHPASCPWSVTFMPRVVDEHGKELSPSMTIRDHQCDVDYEVTENGNDIGLFPSEPGFYWLRIEHITYPSGPWGPREHDVASQWIAVERPRLIVEPVDGHS